MVQHQPPEDLLLDYAAGTLPEPLAVLVATHLTLAPESRRVVHRMEDVGGAMMADLPPETMSSDALDRVMARLDAAAPVDGPVDEDNVAPETGPAPEIAAARDAGTAHIPAPPLPAPLRARLDVPLDKLAWRQRGRQVAECTLLGDYPGFKTRLLRINAGAHVPAHTHHGREFTLVLQGAFSDSTGRYARGDVAVADPEVTHQPVADAGEDCLCLAVTDAPLKMTGPVGRVLNFFIDM